MKLVSHYFEQIQGLEYYPVAVLILFFTLFVVLMWMILRSDKKMMDEFAQIPLENNNLNQETKNIEYHG